LSPESKKAFNLIGIATKAHHTVSGEFSTEKAVKENKAGLVIVAEDASDNTKKMFTNMCIYYKVPIYFFGEKNELGHAMGKEFRASLAVLDKGLANAIEEQLRMIQ
jgi:ribosomal protein L7Ae-like RNA K-turn-binding protein